MSAGLVEQIREHKLPVIDSDRGNGMSCEDSMWLENQQIKNEDFSLPYCLREITKL